MEGEGGIRNVKKCAMISLRSSYQHTIRDHPILMIMLCFLVLLNTLFPLLFSFLLYVSPVIICTALLLGTLLSYGQTTYIPEHDNVDDDTDRGVSTNSVNIVERDVEIMYVSLDDNDVPLVAGHLQVGGDKGDDDGVSDDSEPRNETELIDDQDVAGIQYSMLSKDGVILEDRSGVQQMDDTHDDDDDKEEEEDDDSSISGSSSSESSASGSVSSPDASMTDIMPMLDELHPLLDLEAPQPAHISHVGSDVEDDSGDDEEEEAHDDDDDDDDDDGEEANDNNDQESGLKSAITWTEDDQKNLIDLGTSELERNLRLENLIARRSARRLVVEKNLIDLDSADPPNNIPHISTVRANPFDSIYDLYDNKPIPGSAPSMTLPRKNPFDIPYDSSEEKPDLTGDSFQQEFKRPFLQKDTAFFRRYESFSVGSSAFGRSRPASKWRPYFVPEKFAPDGVNYHSFQRQSSGFSDSKASSNPETGSICSSADEDEKTLIEHDFLQALTQPKASVSADLNSNHAEIGSDADHADVDSDSDHSDAGSDSDHSDIGSCSGQADVESDLDHGKPRSVLQQAKLGNDSDHDESDSSKHSDIDDEAKIKMEDIENHQETEIEINLVASRERRYEAGPNVEVDEEGSTESRSSSSSSSSSDDEVTPYKNENISIKSSLEESNADNVHDVVEDHQIKDPVYDSSPSAAKKLILISFDPSDNHEEEPEFCLPSTSISSDILIEDSISDVHHESSARVTPIDEESQEAASDEDVHMPDMLSVMHHERSIGDVTSIGSETASNSLVANEVSDLHHGIIDSVNSIDKNLLGATSLDVLFADKVADDSSDHVTAIEEESRDAALDADDFNADESGDHVTSIHKDLPEATSSILLAAKSSDDHEIKDPVPPINEDLKETPTHILFDDRISDVSHDSRDHEISIDTDLEEATSGAIVGDKVYDLDNSDRVTSIGEDSLESILDVPIEDETSDVNHESGDYITTTDQNIQDTSDIPVVDKIPDLNHGSHDPISSADEDLQEATSTVVFSDIEEETQDTSSTMDADDEKHVRSSNGTGSNGQ